MIALGLTVSFVFAQAPQAINYQSVVRGSSGEPLTNQNVAFRISLLQGSLTGTSVYEETHVTSTNDFGLANFSIGNGTVINGIFNAIYWSNAPYFVKVEVDASGGTSYVEMGISQLLSVPYSLYAEKAATTDNVDDADADPANELQTISLSNDSIRLSNGGGAVRPALGNLSDVKLQQPQNGEVLQFDGNEWTNIPLCSLGRYYYRDRDDDGLGDKFNPVFVLSGCAAPAGFVADSSDCNDNDSFFPRVWYADLDGDGYGDPNNTVSACSLPSGYVANDFDCDDNNSALPVAWYADTDNDGYGNFFDFIVSCTQPPGYISVHGDCNDNNSDIHPAAQEICSNGIDDNCNQLIDCADGCIPASDCDPCNLNPNACEDGIPCTIGVCVNNNGVADCVMTIDPSTCFINGQCFSAGTTNPSEPCQECNPALSQAGWSPKANGTTCSFGACQSGTCVSQ